MEKIREKYSYELKFLEGQIAGWILRLVAGTQPGLIKKILSEKFGSKTIIVTIEIED